ncbi:hypothetical protein ETB97_007529 [Aspergillus alliaceus]|uniref:Uncharacterized protein n=1 Tax=Petromyces alliaceus TaxID=209559 RepID=A0A8H6E1Q5_PETAA|nr:hypothetical protein ETB97_007529 [Aspergillus burnettii]
MSHGAINPSNILLTWNGEVEIANIGDSMLNGRTLRDRDLDLKAVGSMVIGLNDRAVLVGAETPDTITAESNLSVSAQKFIDNTQCKSVGELLKAKALDKVKKNEHNLIPGIHTALQQHPDAILYFSQATHYNMRKILRDNDIFTHRWGDMGSKPRFSVAESDELGSTRPDALAK